MQKSSWKAVVDSLVFLSVSVSVSVWLWLWLCLALALALATGHLKPFYKWMIPQFKCINGRQSLTLTLVAENPRFYIPASLAAKAWTCDQGYSHQMSLSQILNWELEVYRSREIPLWSSVVVTTFSASRGWMLQEWHTCSVLQAAMVPPPGWFCPEVWCGPSCCQHPCS